MQATSTRDEIIRRPTRLPAVDHVLGGGLVEGATVLLAGQPGTGKTSLVLQVLNGLDRECLFATTEETQAHVEETQRRLGAGAKTRVIATQDLDKILGRAQEISARAVAIDTIQCLAHKDSDGRRNTPRQLHDLVERLNQYAKETETSLWLIGHLTKDGSVAGPVTIQHVVDVVLRLEAPDSSTRRLLRSSKNRFNADKTGHLEITPRGLVSDAIA